MFYIHIVHTHTHNIWDYEYTHFSILIKVGFLKQILMLKVLSTECRVLCLFQPHCEVALCVSDGITNPLIHLNSNS